MKRVGGWLAPRGGSSASKSLTAVDEPLALQEALASAAKILNDEVDEAEAELSKGTSPFHKLGRALTIFLRATLGFEKEIMEQASSRLAEAEESASEHQRRAIRDPSSAHQSKIYPVGSEYALCHAESQLMSAVVAVLSESLFESLKGFQKLRRAFTTLHEISEAERLYVERHRKPATQRSNGHRSPTDESVTSVADESTLTSMTDDAESSANGSGVLTPTGSIELDFADASEDTLNTQTPDEYQGHFEYPDTRKLALQDALTAPVDSKQPLPISSGGKSPPATASAQDEDVDMRDFTTDPIDLFIHAGTSLCFGLLQLLLSMIPPAFSKLLSFFSFRGDRETGMRMLWAATAYTDSINGGMAGLITLTFHSTAIGFCDILSDDAYPKERLRALLTDMRTRYPKSKLWLLEEGRMLSANRQLEKAVAVLSQDGKSPLKQIEAVRIFERSLDYLFLHRYEDCAASFFECMKLNSWSHGLYYYIAAACNVELYRIHEKSDPKRAMKHAESAEEYFKMVPEVSGKKRFMARQLPVDTFVLRKVAKWDQRAKSAGCKFVDAVGVSPLAEMTYFWSGYRRMDKTQLDKTLERLTYSESHTTWATESADEKAILSVLKATVLRFMGRTLDAKSELTRNVLTFNAAQLKSCAHPDTWPLPVAHYELAVCLWEEAGRQGGDAAKLRKCSDELQKVERWESYDLEARVGMKVATARNTLRRCGIE